MKNQFFMQALFKLLNITKILEFYKTRKAVRSGINITDLSMQEFRDKGYMNPWLFCIAESFISTMAATVFVAVISFLVFGSEAFNLNVISGVSPLIVFSYLILVTLMITLFSMRMNDFVDKNIRNKVMAAFLFVSGAYGFWAKLIFSITTVVTLGVINNLMADQGQYEMLMIFLWDDGGWVVLPVLFVLSFVASVFEYHYFSSSIKLSGDMVCGVSLSEMKLKIISALLIFGPILIVNIIINAGLLYELNVVDMELFQYKIIFYVVAMVFFGWVMFFYQSGKWEKLKYGLVTALFINIPMMSTCDGPCSSGPINVFGYYFELVLGKGSGFGFFDLAWMNFIMVFVALSLLSYPDFIQKLVLQAYKNK